LDEIKNSSYFRFAKIVMLMIIAKPKNRKSRIVFGRMLVIFPPRTKRLR
jgi:hypothetical protein